MKQGILLWGLVALILISAGCGNSHDEASVTIYAMDTVMELTAYGSGAEEAVRKAETELLRLDALFGRKDEGSDVYAINNGGSSEEVDTVEIVSRALEISAATDGAFDITIAPVMDLWGFYGKEFRVPSDQELEQALPLVNYENVSILDGIVAVQNGAEIDLGGIAKGYASDRVMDIFRESDVTSGIISLGGNVQTLNTRPDGSRWRVAVQNPDGGQYIGVLELSSMAAVTSGGYQRFFEQDSTVYHHIIDPKTGYPADSGLKSVTIVCEDGTLADGLSTALFVMGLENGTEFWRSYGGFDVVFVTDDNEIYITEGIAEDFTSEYPYEVLR